MNLIPVSKTLIIDGIEKEIPSSGSKVCIPDF